MQQNSNLTIRPDIMDTVTENNLGAGQFMGEKVMPVYNSAIKGATLAKIDFTEVKTGAVDDLRAPGAKYNQVTHELTEFTFTTRERGLIEVIDDSEAAVIGRYFDAEVSAAMLVNYYLRRNMEKRQADKLFDTAGAFLNFKTAVGTSWGTSATATPVKDVENGIVSILDQINGMMMGNAKLVGVCNNTLIPKLRATADVKDRYVQAGEGTTVQSHPQLAATLGLSELHSSSLKVANVPVWAEDKFGIYVVSESGTIKEQVHVGRTFLWTEDSPSLPVMETYRDETLRSDVVRGRMSTDEVLLTARAGHILTGV